jgi:pimeloyl-ACP methyl ester carboxylesterase
VDNSVARLKNGVDIHYRQMGAGQSVVMLHGSGGVGSLGVLPDSLARDHRVIAPSHPGFDGSLRPEWMTTIEHIADSYESMMDHLDLSAVTLIGLSMGGWIAAELALRAPTRVAGVIFIDPIGVEVPGHPILDVFTLTPEEILSANYHNPKNFRVDPSSLTEEQRAAHTANLAAAELYTRSRALHDDGLPGRLGEVTAPALVLWGEDEHIVPRESVEEIARRLGGPARLAVIPEAGHRPQLEQPHATEDEIRAFIGAM